MHCGIGQRHGSDPALLRLWCRPAAVVLIRSLAWVTPYAAGAALKQTNKQTNKQKPWLQIAYVEILVLPIIFFHLMLLFLSFYFYKMVAIR